MVTTFAWLSWRRGYFPIYHFFKKNEKLSKKIHNLNFVQAVYLKHLQRLGAPEVPIILKKKYSRDVVAGKQIWYLSMRWILRKLISPTEHRRM